MKKINLTLHILWLENKLLSKSVFICYVIVLQDTINKLQKYNKKITVYFVTIEYIL